jgi:cytoskeletal protein CcmA (bactofilin family)
MAREVTSYIGEGAEFNGKFYARGQIKINGKFEGDLKADDLIHIGPTGKVKTNIVGRKVIVEGTLMGNITASEDVTITETGRIMGDITTPNLQLGKGVVINGKINITGGQAKSSKQMFGDAFDGKSAKDGGSSPETDDDSRKKTKKK